MKVRIAQSYNPTNKPQQSFAGYFKASTPTENSVAPCTVTLKFKKTKIAHAFLDFVIQYLPLLNTEFPKVDEASVHLTDEQYFYYQRLAMCESGHLSTDYLKDCLLKTLRADEFDFSYQFMLGIIPGDNNSRRLHNLRPSQRKPFLIAPDGTIIPREHKQPMYSPEEKVGFSQPQSNTLLDPNALSRAFGFSRDHRNEKLYGIVTHKDDSLFNRLLTDDSGTVTRIFDFDTGESAEFGLDRLKDTFYTATQLDEFKKANKRARKSNPRTNEVLARIRFNPYRTVISICSDTLEARLLAYDFSQELLDHYKIYAENNSLTVNPNFRIPIIFYIRKNIASSFFTQVYHDIEQYTDQMRAKDEAEAVRIHADEQEKLKYYKRNNFEFLLGLTNITKEILLDKCLDKPLAYIMMKNGYTRMLMRLLKTPALRKHVFDSLIKEYLYLFRKNDPIIASLVLAEQFDLADELVKATNTDKLNIQIERSAFKDLNSYLLHHGNPRQIEYMGLDDMLIKAADKNEWVTVRLCLKEFSNINNSTFIALYSKATLGKKACESKFMLQKCIEIDSFIIELFKTAIKLQHWEHVESLLLNPLNYENKALLGSGLIRAIRDKKVLTARLLIKAGACPEKNQNDKHFIEGALFETLDNRLIELIPDVFKVEEGYTDDDAPIRLLVALHLSQELVGPSSVPCLEIIKKKFEKPDPKILKIVICYLFLKALSENNPQLAEIRLIKLCHHYNFLRKDNNSIKEALDIIMDHFHDAAKSFCILYTGHIFSYITKIYLDEKCGHKILRILTSSDDSTHYSKKLQGNVFYNLFQHMSTDTVEIVKSIKRDFIDNDADSLQKENKLCAWYSKLNDYFIRTINSNALSEEKILCLFDFGLELYGKNCAETLEILLIKGYLKAAEKVMTRPKITEDEFIECVSVLTRYSHTIRALAPTLLNKIKPEHITKLSSQHYARVKDLIMEFLKLDNVNDNAVIITQFYKTAIQRKEWKDVELFTLTPIIHLNKPLLGVALKASIQDKKDAAARLLIKEGALLEKSDSHTHFIEGVLYHTLANRLFELIPDAIEAEAKYDDEAVQIRYLVALQLSYELGNSASICQLENIKDKFENPDPRPIKIAICYVFLKTLSGGNTQLAEERLIKLCHKYHLLSDDNDNINDALDIIIEYYYDASSSISHSYTLYNPRTVLSYIVKHYLSEKNIDRLIFLLTYPKKQSSVYFFCMHGHIYTLLLTHLSHENVTTIKSFICEYINNDKYNQYEFNIVNRWQSDLKTHFESIMSREHYNEENILLLFEIGLTLSEDLHSKALDPFLEKGFLKAASKILADPKLRNQNLGNCIDVLKFYPQHVQFLAPFLSNRIMPSHVSKLCFSKSALRKIQVTKDEIIAMLKHTKNNPTENNSQYWDFYYTLDYSTLTESLEIEKELAQLLKSSTIKHLVLIFVVDRFRCYLEPFQDKISKADTNIWPNLTIAFITKGTLYDGLTRELIETIDPQQSEILAILNNYLIDVNAMPSDEVIEATYTKVMELFEHATQSKSAPASSAGSDQFDINAKFATYMKSLNIELAKPQVSTCRLEASLPTTDENTDSNFGELPVYYLK